MVASLRFQFILATYTKMLKIKNLRGECQHCGGPIEFHAEHVGTSAECPHCNQPTELLLATPPEEVSPLRKKAIVFTVIAILILGGGLIAVKIALMRAKRLQAEHQRAVPAVVPPDPFAAQGFHASPVTLAQEQGSSLVYAVGVITNTSNRQRFGVKVELELQAAGGIKLGVASDYQKVLEPGAGWKFRALVPDKRVTVAKISAINEAQ